jgi:hypothetical protein
MQDLLQPEQSGIEPSPAKGLVTGFGCCKRLILALQPAKLCPGGNVPWLLYSF